MRTIYAVIVLYNQSPAQSAAVRAFETALASDRDLAASYSLLLYDNSPASQQALLPPTLRCQYMHDARNNGLPAAYNYALESAVRAGSTWLMLLDQDTEVGAEYLREAAQLASDLEVQDGICGIVPKLASAKGIKSPTLDFLEWLRRQLQFPRERALFATGDLYGPQQQQWSAFNSGSVFRLSALQQIGGFPSAFWLDFLDVAVCHALHQAGGRLFVMHATLQHELSMDTARFYEQRSGLERHRNLLNAMVKFVRSNGTTRDRWLLRLWLLRNAGTLLINAKNKRFSLESLRQALWIDGETTTNSAQGARTDA